MSAHSIACRDAYQRKQQRRITDPLSEDELNRVILDAALDGCDADQIRARLDQARASADGLVIEDGYLVSGWAY